MSLEERIQEEREEDDGLKKSKQNEYKPKTVEEKGLEHNNPTGVYATMTDADEKSRRNDNGIKLKRKWGLVRCGGGNTQVHKRCPELLIVKKGQKISRCTRCGTQRKIANKKIRAQSDDQEKVRKAKMRLEVSENYSSLGDLDG